MGQRNLRPVKNGPRCQRNLVPTLGALVAPLVHQFVGSFVPASRANEPIWPTTSRQILLAGLLGGKVGLKLAKRLGKCWSGHPLYTTCWGLLKQPDNYKPASGREGDTTSAACTFREAAAGAGSASGTALGTS